MTSIITRVSGYHCRNVTHSVEINQNQKYQLFKECTLNLTSHQNLKGQSVMVYSKLHFFPNPLIFIFFIYLFFFCIFGENSTVITYLYNNFLGNSIFLERETILCWWELISVGNNEFKPEFLVRNHSNLDFLKF